MQTKYINEMLDIPELQIQQIMRMNADEIHIKASPVAPKQRCPICRSAEYVTRKGSNDTRTVRHLSVFEKIVYLWVPSIRMQCSQCNVGFVWVYDFVGPKRRYSNLFQPQHIAPLCNKHPSVPCNGCTTRRFLWKVNVFSNRRGNRRKQTKAWF